MEISLQGYNCKYVTFQAEGEMEPGNLVQISGNNRVAKAVSGKFAGVLHSLRAGYALVQTGGYAEVKYSGTAPGLGFTKLAADASAGTVAGDLGREVLVTSVDSTGKRVGMLF